MSGISQEYVNAKRRENRFRKTQKKRLGAAEYARWLSRRVKTPSVKALTEEGRSIRGKAIVNAAVLADPSRNVGLRREPRREPAALPGRSVKSKAGKSKAAPSKAPEQAYLEASVKHAEATLAGHKREEARARAALRNSSREGFNEAEEDAEFAAEEAKMAGLEAANTFGKAWAEPANNTIRNLGREAEEELDVAQAQTLLALRAVAQKKRAAAQKKSATNKAAAKENAEIEASQLQAEAEELDALAEEIQRRNLNRGAKEAALLRLPKALQNAVVAEEQAVEKAQNVRNIMNRGSVARGNVQRAVERVAASRSSVEQAKRELAAWKAAHAPPRVSRAPRVSRSSRAAVPRTVVTRSAAAAVAKQGNDVNIPPPAGGRRTRRRR